MSHTTSEHKITIQRIGAEGDGIATDGQGNTYYIPFTLPHETVTCEAYKTSRNTIHARATQILMPSIARVSAPCTTFGECGGCQLQHASEDTYTQFKEGKLASVLHRLNVPAHIIQPMVMAGWGSRRRIDLAVSSKRGEIILGFHGAFHPHVVDIQSSCLIAEPIIQRILPSITILCGQLQRPKHLHGIQIQAINLDTLDITLRTRQTSSAADMATWAHYGNAHPEIARISEIQDDDESFARTLYGAPVHLHIADIPVELPAGAFLQAASAGQIALTEFVLTHTKGAQRIIDCYCGLGTYSLPLAKRGATVLALEGSESMIHALYNASRRAQLDDRLTATTRDLYRSPLPSTDISRYDAIVINPPRNGALPQTHAIAKSTIARVVMISCNPITFERDAKILLQSGYRMTSVQAIDQFTMTSHLEIAACFEK